MMRELTTTPKADATSTADQPAYNPAQSRLLAIARRVAVASIAANEPLRWTVDGAQSDTYLAYYSGRRVEASSGSFCVDLKEPGEYVPRLAHLSANAGPEAAVVVASVHAAAEISATHIQPGFRSQWGRDAPRTVIRKLDQMLR